MARRGEFPPRDGYRDYIPQGLKRMINKSMNVDPAQRYQTADDMRHALEHQHFCVDWIESIAPTRSVWEGKDARPRYYKVTKVKQSNGRWSVETRRGNSADTLRRIGELCFFDLRMHDAARRTRRVLQDFVNGNA